MRRCEGACNRTGAPSVAFYESGGAGKRLDIFLGKEKRSKVNFAPTWQGQKDSNPRHTVLETVALPAELYPYIKRK